MTRCQKHCSGEEATWEDQPPEHRIRGRRAVFVAGSPGKKIHLGVSKDGILSADAPVRGPTSFSAASAAETAARMCMNCVCRTGCRTRMVTGGSWGGPSATSGRFSLLCPGRFRDEGSA